MQLSVTKWPHMAIMDTMGVTQHMDHHMEAYHMEM